MPLLPLFLSAACTPPRLPDPIVDAVEPSFAYNGEDEPVTILGENFWPEITIDAGNGDAEIDRSYRAWLVGPDGSRARHELVGVGILDDRHLSATVAAGLASGGYALSVEGPTGVRASLPGTFLVTDEQAAYLAVDSERSTYAVTELAPVQITLADLDGNRVDVNFEVVITGVTESGEGTIEFQVGTLDAVPTPNGAGLRGFLVDGGATFFVRPTIPDKITLTVAPSDPSSEVIAGAYELRFEPGADRSVRFQLPLSEDAPVFVAGEPFDVIAEIVDQYGNAVDDRTVVALGTECSGWFEAGVELEGATAVQIVPRFATGVGCPEDRVVVASGPAGESDPYTVRAGALDHFAVAPQFATVQAGDPFLVFVYPEDIFGNIGSWTGTLTVSDSAGGVALQSCNATGLFPLCDVTLTKAVPEDLLQVVGDDGLTGVSPPVRVLPDDVATDAAVTVVGPAAAGVPIPVEVRALDAWGNVMDAALLDAGAITVTDDLGEATCAPTGFLPDGAATFACTLLTARLSAVVTADLPAFGVVAAAAPIGVTNGALAVVRFSGEQPVEAGQIVPLSILAEDAFGNRYLLQADPVIALADDTGTFSLASVTLAADGTAAAAGSITVAGSTTVHASQAGVTLGSSGPIPVGAGPTSGLALTLLVPWAWQDDPAEVQVETVDAFGNRTDDSGGAALTSTTTASPTVPVALVNGVGTAAFTWTETAFVDVLQGDLGAFAGATDVVVVRDCGGNGPVPDLSFGGFADAIACLDPATGAAPVVADLSGSTPGLRPITGYAAARDGGPTVADSQPILDLELPGIGAYGLHGLAVASNGCGAEVEATGWAGPDDDTPVGPIPLSTVATEVPVSTLASPVVIDVTGVVDCSRDPAAFQEIHLRTTAGTLTGPAPSGVGPVLVLDAAGEGAVDLETAGLLSDGTAEVHAWVDSGAAGGLLSLPLVGDSVRPIVIAQDPTGVFGAPVSELTLTFSEPMLAGTLTAAANWSVAGPSPVTVIAVGTSGSDAVLTLDPPADGAAGLWTLTAASLVRDAAGNRLAGDWGPNAAAYVGAFGGSGGPPAALTCTGFEPGGLAIRPDGDDGPDGEADAIVVSLSSPAAPAWWVVEVTDAGGGLVHQDWAVPFGPSDTVSWDGRGLDGRVVPNGGYDFEVRPDDGLGNRGDGCAFTVTVDARVGAAP